jgi:hypothetical protein
LNQLQSDDLDRRRAAIHALESTCAKWSLPLLVELLDDPTLRKVQCLGSEGFLEEYGFSTWPDGHYAHQAIRVIFSHEGPPPQLLNGSGGTFFRFDVDKEMVVFKAWWDAFGTDFLNGRPTPQTPLSPIVMWVH